MSEEQASQILQKLDDIALMLNNPDEQINSIMELLQWLETIASWLSFHVGVWVPGILVLGLFWWLLSQFLERYY